MKDDFKAEYLNNINVKVNISTEFKEFLKWSVTQPYIVLVIISENREDYIKLLLEHNKINTGYTLKPLVNKKILL